MHRTGLASLSLLLAAGLGCDNLQSIDQPVFYETGLDGSGSPGGGGPGGGVDDTDDTLVNPGGTNNPPRANAGADKTGLLPGTTLTLDGSLSSDLDGDALDYTWTLIEKPPGSSTSILNPDFEQATLYLDIDGTFRVQLTVSDGVAENTDEVRFTVLQANLPPIADAGFDQRVEKGTTVQLSGNGSYDPDDDALEYYWTFLSAPPGSARQFSGANIPSTAVSPSFIADVAGIFTIELVVSDGQLQSQPDLLSITVTDSTTGGGSSGGGSSSSDCLDCAAEAGGVAQASWTSGGLASSFGLLGLPFLVVLWQRRREDD